MQNAQIGSLLRRDNLKMPKVEEMDTSLFLVIFITAITLCVGMQFRAEELVQMHRGNWSLSSHAVELPGSLQTLEIRQTELVC